MKALYAGAGLALAAGVLLGGAMRPTLGGDDRPEGPQVFEGWTGTRATGPFDTDPGSTTYAVPDEAASAPLPEVARADPPPSARPAKPEPDDQVTAYAGDEAIPVYASEDLGPDPTLAEDDDRPAPAARFAHSPESTAPQVDIDPEAPPEATGDTTPAAG